MQSGSVPGGRTAGHGRMRWRGTVATAASVVLGTLLALAPAVSASAHDYPVTWSPKPGSTVTTPPKTVSITFDDIVLNLAGDSHTSLLRVTGPTADDASQKRYFATACTTTSGRTIRVPVSLGAAGTYTIAYQIVSADGHVVSGKQTFTYQPASGVPESKGSAAPVCGDAGPTPRTQSAQAVAPGSSTSSSSSSLGVVVGIVGAIIALAVIAIVVVLVTARRPAVRGNMGGSTADSAADTDAAADDGNARGGRRGRSRWRPDEE